MPDSLTIQLVNQTTSSNVYAYITGLALQRDCARVLLKADGKGLHYPASPAGGKILQPLAEDCAIALGAPGNTATVTIPQIAGGRIWFSAGERKLTFLLNPGGPGGGAALVEPSVLNPSDPNAGVDFCFCEFTLNSDQLFANISYVDFVARLPIALTLRTRTGAVQHVSGMPADGLTRVCDGLCAQAARDGRPWDKLIVSRDGQPLRVLSPTHGEAVGASFTGYFEPLVDAAWQRYREQQQAEARGRAQGEPQKHGPNLLARLEAKAQGQGPDQQQAQQSQQPSAGCALLRINTQAAAGIVTGSVAAQSDELILAGESFKRPTTADILGCNSGPFTTGPSATRNAIIPRLAAAFQRSAIAADGVDEHPSQPDTFYRCEPTNHYSRVVHAANLDGKGYSFAYDDVQPDGGADQSGKVNAGDPDVFVVAVGGGGAYVGDRMP